MIHGTERREIPASPIIAARTKGRICAPIFRRARDPRPIDAPFSIAPEMLPAVTTSMPATANNDAASIDPAVTVIRQPAVAIVGVVRPVIRICGDADIAVSNASAQPETDAEKEGCETEAMVCFHHLFLIRS